MRTNFVHLDLHEYISRRSELSNGVRYERRREFEIRLRLMRSFVSSYVAHIEVDGVSLAGYRLLTASKQTPWEGKKMAMRFLPASCAFVLATADMTSTLGTSVYFLPATHAVDRKEGVSRFLPLDIAVNKEPGD